MQQSLDDFWHAQRRLFSLVTDPEGKGHRIQRSAAELREREQTRMRRVASFLAYAGHPEAAFSSVHIAGTSGKGSVTTMIAACLQQAGYSTGYHISPYLQSPTEN